MFRRGDGGRARTPPSLFSPLIENRVKGRSRVLRLVGKGAGRFDPLETRGRFPTLPKLAAYAMSQSECYRHRSNMNIHVMCTFVLKGTDTSVRMNKSSSMMTQCYTMLRESFM